jgi:hypothetical protein
MLAYLRYLDTFAMGRHWRNQRVVAQRIKAVRVSGPERSAP